MTDINAGGQGQDVKTKHRDYDNGFKAWQKVRHALSGDLKSYLRNVGQNEPDKEYGAKRQKEYEDGAICYNFTKRTLAGMVGAVMRKPPEVHLQKEMETKGEIRQQEKPKGPLDYLFKNCDGSGVGLVQHAQDTLSELDSVGRGGLLVDAPNIEVATMAEQNAGLLNPTIAFYAAENITNWRLERVGSVNRVVMVVLREWYEYTDGANEFYTHIGEQYRVLDIFEGKYRQRIYQFGYEGELRGDVLEIFPTLGNLPAGEIPFTFIGATNNDHTIDDAPLLPLAELNIGHYRNSADNEENTFVTGQVMLTVSPGESISPEMWQELNPEGVKFGARRGLNLGAGGSASLLQANASTAARQGMLDKEQQAVQIGAQLITPTQQVTAESARLQRGADTSVMATIAENVSEAYEKALKWVAQMMKQPDTDIEFHLNTEFFLQQMTAQDRAAWMADINAGLLPATAYYAALRKAGVTDWKDEEIQNALLNQPLPTNTTDVSGDIPANASNADNQDTTQEESPA